MLDQLVQVLVPQVGILILEIGSHGHDNVVGLIVFGLKGTTWRNHKCAYLLESSQLPSL